MTDHDLTTVPGRVEAICDWFEIEPPSLDYEDGELLVNEGLVDWCGDNAVSIDWVICNDPRGAIAASREKWTNERMTLQFAQIVSELSDADSALLLNCMKATNEGVPFEEAIQPLRERVAAA